MITGWLVRYWPGTKCAMYVGDWGGDAPVPEDAVFLPLKKGPPPVAEARPGSLDNQLLELNSLKMDAEEQKAAFSTRVGVLRDAVRYDIATSEEVEELEMRASSLEEWEKYAVLIGRVASLPKGSEPVSWPDPPAERI